MGMGEWRSLKQDEEFLKNLVQNCREFWRDEANYSEFRTLPVPPDDSAADDDE